jgi:hypothetical protein
LPLIINGCHNYDYFTTLSPDDKIFSEFAD